MCGRRQAIVVDERGLSVFDVLRYRLRDHDAVLCAFDLIELDGEDLRWRPLEHRKARLADLLRGVRDGIAFNQHFTADGSTVFRHAEVPQRNRIAGVFRRLARVMAELGWTAVRVRDLTSGGYREQIRGYCRQPRNMQAGH
jgi:hypothetical protein